MRELELAARDGRLETEAWRVRKDGSRFWAHVVITALRNPVGELVGFAKVTRDLTEQQRLQQEQLARTRAEEAIRLRDDFLSLASHELRTPLSVLQLQLDMLHRRLQASDNAVAAKLQRASRSSERLANLIESLLEVSRIATGRFALEAAQCNLIDVVRGAIEELGARAADAGCEVRVTGEGSVVGTWDRGRLQQVIGNLVANAIKYAPRRPIDIEVAGASAEATVVVRDHGPGIPESDLSRLFRRFERGSASQNYGGLGLGLYFVQEIVAAHGGVVSAENAQDGGARFIVRLPTTGGRSIASDAEPAPPDAN